MAGPWFPVPGDYAGDPPPAEGLRRALALATERDLALASSVLVSGSKVAAGLRLEETVTAPLTGAPALLAWLAALVHAERERRASLMESLEGDGDGPQGTDEG